MLEIDGAHGEGGGQILRTALAVAATTGTPCRIVRIRAGRGRPGLLAQHLAAVRMAATIADAEVAGATLGSSELTFVPRRLCPGEHTVDVGTAGSACLVAQVALTPLLHAPRRSTVRVSGGTHNRAAPPAEFLQRTFLPVLAQTGVRAELRLERHGFEPVGGGRVTLRVEPARRWVPLTLTGVGPARPGTARALLSRLPRHVGDRELDVVARELGWPREQLRVEEVRAAGPGNILLLEVERPAVTEVVSAVGLRGVAAEEVARRAVSAARQALAHGPPVGPHLADQLLVPLALGGGGTFRTTTPTTHFTTNVHTLRRFVDTPITWTSDDDGTTVVHVGRARATTFPWR